MDIDTSRLFGTGRPRRPNVMARRHVVVSGHYWASQAGFQILEAGGNAIDAGVATGLAIEVLESELVGFGGVAPVMIHLAERDETVVISGVGTWPSALDADYFHRHHGGRIPEGILCTVVPSAPDIWITALERYGTMRFADVAAAAIRFARDGFPMYPMFREYVLGKLDVIRAHASTAAVFLPGGRVPEVGEIFRQTDLAGSLQYMADEERAAGGSRLAGLAAARAAFYRGDIGRAIVRHQRENGGFLSEADMAGFRAPVEAPCRTRFREYEMYGCGPWSQGPMLLEALNILEPMDLHGMGHNSAAYIHALAEALKLAAADREAHFGDPLFNDIPLDTLLSRDFAAWRRAEFDPARAWPGLPPAGAVGGVRPAPWRPDPSGAAAATSGPPTETSFLCVSDSAGNIFAATPSDPALGGAIVPGTGIMPSNWGSRGYTAPDHPGRVGPGRRPRMSANPALAILPGVAKIPFGSPGSEVLGQAMLQVFLNMAVFGMDPQSAVEAPRFASYSWPESQLPHNYLPGRLNVEEDVGAATLTALSGLGHDVVGWPERKYLAGSVVTIRDDLASGVKWAGADPRRTAMAVGW